MGHNKHEIPSLGFCRIDSPLIDSLPVDDAEKIFMKEDDKILLNIRCAADEREDKCADPSVLSLERSGPREKIFFDPKKTKAAIVTCGGICPGLNDVIRSITMTLFYRYGVTEILGIRNGYQGLVKRSGLEPMKLDVDIVDHINHTGGTILGTSRGEQDADEMLDFIVENKINQLFVIGGDGTMRGAIKIAEAAEKRKIELSVAGIPKTVDNDILYIDRSFGFITASSMAGDVVETAHNEAKSQNNGVGLVKLMGRNSGFIACLAALASGNANFVLIPEVPFDLEGEKGFLRVLEERLKRRHHAVVLVAEGAGQEHISSTGKEEKDASGNIKFKDIGVFLRDRINDHFRSRNIEINLKYIDPSYIVRAIGTSPIDSIYCYSLGKNAVHAAMSGKTKLVVGMVHNEFVHIPMSLITRGRRKVDHKGELWFSVLECTGQPAEFRN
ncbi:MAG TPA: ATP-dependent 6-phosphofructokinase [Candidatus Omnitrophota bacterium]|nr:ATP-dependent 6-phosphofructokinase [Candidatus Omnitrophota bacterium]HPS20502.1 ATP-dependent 6-phosphofructokinase [Candidatus Omnitrophota bacterium]